MLPGIYMMQSGESVDPTKYKIMRGICNIVVAILTFLLTTDVSSKIGWAVLPLYAMLIGIIHLR